MNRPSESHEPTPEFRAYLEWQVETAMRRESRFTAPAAGRVRRLSAALIVVAALATGGIAGVASGRVQDARQRDRLIEAARSEESLVRLRVDLARADYQDARSRFEIGTVGPETLMASERQMREMEAALARLHLDIDEIQLTSAPPRNDLDAPMVGGRDFVRDRLALELSTAQQALTAAEQARQQAQSRFEVGMAPPAAVLQANAEQAQARARMQQLAGTLDLRQRFLRGEIKADALAQTSRRMELTVKRESAQTASELAKARLDQVRSLVEIGRASELEVKRAEVELLERQIELKRIQQEFDRLGPSVR